MPDKSHILLIGGEHHVRELLGEFLDKLGYASLAVDNLAAALDSATMPESFAVLIDFSPLDRMRMEEITMLRQVCPAIRIIVMTGNPTLELLLEGIRYGVSDVVIKPFRYEELRDILTRAEVRYCRVKETLSLRKRISELEERICELENIKAAGIDRGGDRVDSANVDNLGMPPAEGSEAVRVCGTGAETELPSMPASKNHLGTTRCCVGQRGY